MRAVGMILWAARNVFMECMVGASMLCRVMSAPSEIAWNAAMHMIKWMYQQRNRGIKFTSAGNETPIAFSDASNKADPVDGCCQAGHCVMWQGGPITVQSKKLRHCSPRGSASHNEYMALSECNQQVVRIRQLLGELHMDDVIEKPTVVYGDNKQANNLCKEDFISTGNQYIYQSYQVLEQRSTIPRVCGREICTNKDELSRYIYEAD